jgi:PAS domain S-box-containing protein
VGVKSEKIAETEAALRESEERFRQFAENIQEVFWMTDIEKHQMLYISPAYEKIWGRTLQSLYDKPLSFLDAIHPDDRDRVVKAISTQTDGNYDELYKIVRPDGTIRWIRDRAFPIKDRNGKIYRMCGIAEEITKAKKAEHDLRLLANIVSMSVDAISTGNPDGTVSTWNKAAENIFGFTAEEIIGKDVRQTLIPPERQHESEMTLVKDPRAVVRMRTERLHKSGRRIPVMVTTFPLIDDQGRVYARAGIHQDLTHVVEMEKMLVEQSRMAAVGTMAAGIAHEIRNPLFGISSVAQILVREAHDKPSIQELGESMLSEIGRLNRLLKDLLTFTRPRRMESSHFFPQELFEEFANLHKNLKTEKRVRFDTVFEPPQTQAFADRDQIQQVIFNLGINALQAAPEGSTIRVRSEIKPKAFWSFQIQNGGDPIPGGALSTIFEPFYSTKAEGSGLGLSVCKKIIEDHQGTLWCESSSSGGTQFTFRIPLTS